MASDHKSFNCYDSATQDPYHEMNYRASLYEKSSDVKEFLKKKCQDGTIRYWTHQQVKELLSREGYVLKNFT